MMEKAREKVYRKKVISVLCSIFILMLVAGCGSDEQADNDKIKITNVSYDPTREFYIEYNNAFQKHYKEMTGKDVEIVQSHGGSGSQARSVVEGSSADVVTLALAHDVEMIEKAGLIDKDWIDEFDKESAPYTSTIVFLVRKGNEKQITDWDDLIKPEVKVITPDPKSSGGACWNFLASWQYGLEKFGSEAGAKDFVKALYKNVAVMDSGARASTTTFVENGQGDVLIAWENEAIQTVKEYPDKFEIVTPSISILAQPSVAVVDKNVKRGHKAEVSKEYLAYLYSEEGQRLAGKYGYRPSNLQILQEFSDRFNLNVKLCTIDDFGGWNNAYEKFFEDGAIFDEIHED